ncbi:extracellular solute-binding protein [Agathobaculum sp. NTUH-O15-33]|uniref:ABC transporter substrate-binding protein n=1 Tax=Agathobaculum sp. NTUH-O15-33 TaxID=3079302 RepID=UPI00295849E4|nr:extracellular solute-binding protein [Agathobaculum sp. NTUH-O15-33]WNX85281.1 extracellular solute-binding protein [Agathobaculum sp. NTUH-O15-33]
MKAKNAAALALAACLTLLCGCSGRQAQITELNILNWGYEDTRYTNLYQAVQTFNARHPDRPYALQVEKYRDADWDEYQALCEKRHEEGRLDLFATGHEYIGALADGGVIAPMDELLRGELFQQEYFPTVWSSVEYEGQYWGMPIDLDVQMVFIHKDALRAAGYTATEASALPERTARGEFTMEALIDIARAAKAQGGFRYGLLHRPPNGQFFYMLASAYGALEGKPDGSITFDEQRYAEMLRFYQSLTQEGLLPPDLTEWEWVAVNQAFASGDAAVYFGASYSLYDVMIECGALADDVIEQYVPILFPAVRQGGRPITISHPMVYVIDSGSRHQKDIEEILTIAFADSQNSVNHCVTTYHLPASVSAAENAVFHNNAFLTGSMYMLDYTIFLPVTADIRTKMTYLFEDVSAAERAADTPEALAQAAAFHFSQ